MTVIKFRGKVPVRATPGAAGFDLVSAEDVGIGPLETVTISTGTYLEIPEGFEAQIRGRSGLASQGIFCHTGTIDSDYRGEIKVVLTYVASEAQLRLVDGGLSIRTISVMREPFGIEKGDRIAQIVFSKVEEIELKRVRHLSKTRRGKGGFGSTGRR